MTLIHIEFLQIHEFDKSKKYIFRGFSPLDPSLGLGIHTWLTDGESSVLSLFPTRATASHICILPQYNHAVVAVTSATTAGLE